MLSSSRLAILFSQQLTLSKFIPRIASLSTVVSKDSTRSKELWPTQDTNQNKEEPADWKKGVVIHPIQTTIEDLVKSHKLIGPNGRDGIYISHQIYLKEIPKEYSVEPFRTYRTGGRDIDTRERLFYRVGGGLPVEWYFVDFKRLGPASGQPLVERVLKIFASRDRTSFIALVAHGDIKRLILATENMKEGDLIKSTSNVPHDAILNLKDGDAYPCGVLKVGTVVHNIECIPGEGGTICRAAGSSATVTGKLDGRVVITLPSGDDIALDQSCMVTLGKTSHASYKDEKMSHPVENRDRGKRPDSGLWHRKDGYCGRKVHVKKPPKVQLGRIKEENRKINYTYGNWNLTK